MATIPTLEEMREAIAQLVGVPTEEIADDANLMDLGLDSIRAMSLVQRWANAGAAVDFAELAEEPTLRHWWTVMARQSG